ncbi:TetR/AcrR family transcriptional regulator [Methylobacterium oryzae CBMB20]
MAYGYGGLNFRDLAEIVGIKAASITYHFATKAQLGEAVAQRYWEDIARDLESHLDECPKPGRGVAAVPRASSGYPWSATIGCA